MATPRIIIFDLETLPNLPEALKVWPQLSNYPGLTLKATISTIICAGYKVLGGKTYCINAWDFTNWKRDVNDDSQVVKALYEVLNTADAVVTHNGKRFDWRHLQTRLVYHGLPPLHKIHHIDTCQVAKRNLYAFNNRLNTIGELTVREEKLKHEGWDLWVKVHQRKSSAMRLMTRYCKQDVNLLEKVYISLRPFMREIPNHNLFVDDRVCPNCGSDRLQYHGWRHTSTQTYRRMKCLECHTVGRLAKTGKMLRNF